MISNDEFNRLPRALTIAGSDSGGGAGIQADLKTFQELGVFGMSALTAVTAQNTTGVYGVYPITPEAVADQIRAVGSDIGVHALKTGMLFSSEIIEAVAGTVQEFGWDSLIVDPVMIAKGGASLLQDEAVRTLTEKLLPQALIVTPNIPEAERLTGVSIAGQGRQAKLEAAKILHSFGVKYVVLKGGHDADEAAVDLFYDGNEFVELEGRRITTVHTHGTGCTFSAAITAGIAAGLGVPGAVKQAKAYIQAAIEDSLEIGSGHGPTNHWAYRRRQSSEAASSSLK